MTCRKLLCLLVYLLALISTHGQTAPMTLFATGVDASVPDFTVGFNDSGDGRLQLGEVTEFSGITLNSVLYDVLVGVPDILDKTDCGGAAGLFGCQGWGFSPSSSPLSGAARFVGDWTYILRDASHVPTPGSLALMALAGAGMAFSLGYKRNSARVSLQDADSRRS